MHVQVSLTLEIAASASLAEMDQQIQEVGKPAMREAFEAFVELLIEVTFIATLTQRRFGK
jgi:hypothetical protein